MASKIKVLAALLTRRLAKGGRHSIMMTKPAGWKRFQRREVREERREIREELRVDREELRLTPPKLRWAR